MRYAALATLACVPLSAAFGVNPAVSRVSFGASAGVAGLGWQRTAAPMLRAERRHGLLAAAAVEYTVEKGEEVQGGAGHKYSFTVTVPGDMSENSYVTIMKDFKKNAQFPGFRKGTIPPFMMPKVKQFVILDCLEKTLAEAVKDEGLELVSDEVKPTLDDEQTKALTKEFKEKEGFKYTIDCELKPGDSEMGNIGLTEEQSKV